MSQAGGNIDFRFESYPFCGGLESGEFEEKFADSLHLTQNGRGKRDVGDAGLGGLPRSGRLQRPSTARNCSLSVLWRMSENYTAAG